MVVSRGRKDNIELGEEERRQFEEEDGERETGHCKRKEKLGVGGGEFLKDRGERKQRKKMGLWRGGRRGKEEGQQWRSGGTNQMGVGNGVVATERGHGVLLLDANHRSIVGPWCAGVRCRHRRCQKKEKKGMGGGTRETRE